MCASITFQFDEMSFFSLQIFRNLKQTKRSKFRKWKNINSVNLYLSIVNFVQFAFI